MGWSATARRAWLTLLFSVLAGAFLIPAWRVYLVPAVAVLSAGLAVKGLRAWRPAAASAWWTVTSGVIVLAVGYVISTLDAGRWPDLQRVYPQPYDTIFLVGSVTVIVGAVMLLSRIHPSHRSGDFIDAIIVAVGLGSLVVQRMFGEALATDQPIGVSPLFAVTFPLASVILLTAVARVLLTGAQRNQTMILLNATVVAAVVSDIPRARQAAEGTLPYDNFYAALSVVKLALFAWAVVSPSVADPRLYEAARPTLGSRTRLLVVAVLGYAGPAILTAGWVMVSRVRLSGRTVMSVLKESLDHGKTPIDSC